MARAHCDTEIKAYYVMEACRLMKSSNINVIKGDVDLTYIQEGLNDLMKKELAAQGGQAQVTYLFLINIDGAVREPIH